MRSVSANLRDDPKRAAEAMPQQPGLLEGGARPHHRSARRHDLRGQAEVERLNLPDLPLLGIVPGPLTILVPALPSATRTIVCGRLAASRQTPAHLGHVGRVVAAPDPAGDLLIAHARVQRETGFVWSDEIGEAYRPDKLASAFIDAQDGLGLPRLVFHGLRHSSATILLAAGLPITLVSERLGHSKVSVTLDVYGHAIPSHGADAARVIGKAIYGAEVVGS